MLCNTGHCSYHTCTLQVRVYVCTAGIIITTCGGLSKTTHEIWKRSIPFLQNVSSILQALVISGKERQERRWDWEGGREGE